MCEILAASAAPSSDLRGRSGRLVTDNALDLEKLLDAPIGVFTAVAGLLVAAERGAGVPGRIVEVDVAGAHPGRDLAGMVDIARLNIGGQAIDRVVRHADGVLLGLVRQDRQDG